MTTEPARLTGPAASAQSAARKPKIDPRYIAPIFISCVLLAAHLTAGVLVSPWKTGLAIVAAIVTELFLGRVYYGKWPHLASAYVSGISIGILLRSEAAYWPYAYCAAVSIYSKYVIRAGNRHLWNPSNFGIVVTLLVAPYAVNTLSQEFGNSFYAMVAIWMIGAFIISRLKRFHICATYVISFFVLAWLRTAITKQPFLTEVAPITGPMYQLFTFFMITDPRTTVSSKRGQMVVAFLVALAEAFFRIYPYIPAAYAGGEAIHTWVTDVVSIHAPYFALFFVGPAANLVELWAKKRSKPGPAVAAPAAA